MPQTDAHLSIRILEDALEKLELLEAMQSLQVCLCMCVDVWGL